MSNAVTVNVSDFRSVLNTLHVLVPKGETSMPIGVYVKSEKLTIVCVQGCVYQSEITVDNASEYSITVMYRDISPILPTTGTIELEFTVTGILVSGEGFDASFPAAYSVVEKFDFSDIKYTEILSYVYHGGLKTILNVGLEKLYGTVSQIAIFDSIALQKLPNIWVQTRATGLQVNAVVDTDHASLLLKFDPTHVSDQYEGVLTFKEKQSVLQIPCKAPQDRSTILGLLDGMEKATRVGIGSYLERLKSVVKFGSKEHCKIAIHDGGIKSTLTHENSSVSITSGNVTTPIIAVVELPIQLWLSILKALGNDHIEILYGGGKLCLRTPFTIIVVRVLN